LGTKQERQLFRSLNQVSFHQLSKNPFQRRMHPPRIIKRGSQPARSNWLIRISMCRVFCIILESAKQMRVRRAKLLFSILQMTRATLILEPYPVLQTSRRFSKTIINRYTSRRRAATISSTWFWQPTSSNKLFKPWRTRLRIWLPKNKLLNKLTKIK